MADEMDGPYLVAATFCDQIIEDKGGVFTLVRLVDQLTLSFNADELPEGVNIPAIPHRVSMFISFRRGNAPAEMRLQTWATSPAGERKLAHDMQIVFPEGPTAKVNVQGDIGIVLKESGLYTLDVCLDGRLMTRIMLEGRVVRETTSPSPDEESTLEPDLTSGDSE